jgi:glycosyltransferase involved in cell wall biosynthesis
LFLGFIRPYKGVDVLLRAIAKLKDIDLHLHIAGECWLGPDALRQQVEDLGIGDRVTLDLRYLGDEEVSGLLALADALVLPYREASGSGVAALALQYEKPVVATRVGGLIEYVVDGKTGYLVEPEDSDALAAGIRRLLEPTDWSATMASVGHKASWEGLVDTLMCQLERIRGEGVASNDGSGPPTPGRPVG